MSLFRLNPLKFQQVNKSLLSRITQKDCSKLRWQSKTTSSTPEDEDKPIQFSTSPAASWTAEYSQSGKYAVEAPWYQKHIVAFSTGIFLIYFLVLREPNDIDEMFDKELGDHFPNAEAEIQKRFPNEDISKIAKY